ncbi:hypothetical protein ACWFQT_15340, partial [Cellulosimicrobium cellulans]
GARPPPGDGARPPGLGAALATWIPGDPPELDDLDAVATWLARAVVVRCDPARGPVHDLAHDPAPPEGRP